MRIFKGNTIKIAVACFIIFMAIPFIFVESSDVKKGQGPTIPMEQSANPITRFLDRIGSFYGFKKGHKGKSAKAVNSSFDKAPLNLASAKKQGRFIPPGNLRERKNPEDLQQASDAKTGIIPDNAPSVKAKLPEVKEYVRMDGGTYEVIKDHEGRKYVALPDGFVPYEKLMSDTVSQEEFEAAKAQAPQLEDWEIFEALRTPGGLPAYIANGGSNTYSKNNNYGAQHSKYANKEGTRLFGRAGSGKGGLDDDIYDERKLAQSIQANKGTLNGNHAALTSSLKNKYNDVNKNNDTDNAVNANNEDFSSLIGTGIVIGYDNNVNVKGLDNNQGRQTFASRNTAAQTQTITPVGVVGDKQERVNDYMARVMEIDTFYGTDDKGNKLNNPWIYPQNIETDRTPGAEFYNSNSNRLNEIIRDKFTESDQVYARSKDEINGLRESIPNFKIAVVDGIDANGQVQSVDINKFHYKIVQGLTGAKPLSGKYLNIKPEEKADTLVVVSDADSFNRLKRAGYNVVIFNNFAITPADTENFYGETALVVENMARAKQLADAQAAKKPKNSADLAKDVANAKVGVRGT